MKQKTLYLINTVATLVFAVGLFLMPLVMFRLFGMNDTKQAVTLGQFIAVELTISGLITLLLRDTSEPKTRSAINIANMTAGVLGLIVALNGTLTGAFGWFGWVIVAIYAFVAIAFGYIQFFAWGE